MFIRRCGGMVDTRDLKSLVGNNVPVRVRSPAPKDGGPAREPPSFGIGDRLTRPSPGDGGVSRLVPGGDSSPALSLFERSNAREPPSFGVGDRLTRPSPGDGGASRLVPGGDSSPVISLN